MYIKNNGKNIPNFFSKKYTTDDFYIFHVTSLSFPDSFQVTYFIVRKKAVFYKTNVMYIVSLLNLFSVFTTLTTASHGIYSFIQKLTLDIFISNRAYVLYLNRS